MNIEITDAPKGTTVDFSITFGSGDEVHVNVNNLSTAAKKSAEKSTQTPKPHQAPKVPKIPKTGEAAMMPNTNIPDEMLGGSF